jgi:aryl-alcohol dehydrogenase-like predicted oxidoreductase
MKYIQLKHTDLTISRLIFGCEPLGGTDWGKVDENLLAQSVSKALDLGINCFDVANVYGLGLAEERLSEILGSKRHEVVTISKFGVNWETPRGSSRAKTFLDCSPERVILSLEGSLRRLRVDCIPIYLIHWPDPKTPIDKTLEVLLRCQKEGKIQYFGVSNFPLTLLREANNFKNVGILELQYNLIDRSPEEELLPYCQIEKINVFAYGALAQGLLTGKYDASTTFEQDDRRHRLPHFQPDAITKNLRILDKLKTIGDQYEKTVSQVAIRWILDNPSISAAIVGAKTPYQTEINLGALDWQLTDQERAYLN